MLSLTTGYSYSGGSTSVQCMCTQGHHGTGIESAGIHSEIVAVESGVLAVHRSGDCSV